MTLPARLPDVSTASLPPTYERAKEALAQCQRIDECKDWADKAAALASYAKQAEDDTLRKLAMLIAARAIRRCGDLLLEFDARGGDRKSSESKPRVPTGLMSRRHAAEAAGMSEHQELQAVRVANVPLADFEAALESDEPPTVTELAARGTTHRPGTPLPFTTATALIGHLKSLALFCQEHSPEHVAAGVQHSERARIDQHIGTIGRWLETFTTVLEASCSRR